jgi:chemotaxis protein MotB
MGLKKKHEEQENHERWLVSYADFITLLFAFFTTLYAISTVDAEKYGKMVLSMQASFDSPMFDPGSTKLALSAGQGGTRTWDSSHNIVNNISVGKKSNMGEATFQTLKDIREAATSKGLVLYEEKDLERLKRSVETLLGDEISKGKIRTFMEPRGLIISLGEGGFFDSGSDQIKPEGRALLDTLATRLVSMGNRVRIEGHTDNVPISNSKFPSNWELSTARATVIISYLIKKFGLPPELLSAAGYSEYRPTADNETVEGRARNRRVDIVILNPQTSLEEPG